jgi:hypothetical protein
MSTSLEKALEQVDLEPGRVYRCQVKGQWVVVRVLEPGQVESVSRYDESDVMLDPWVEFPFPKAAITVVGKFGPSSLPDVPEIPPDEDAP